MVRTIIAQFSVFESEHTSTRYVNRTKSLTFFLGQPRYGFMQKLPWLTKKDQQGWGSKLPD